MKKAAYFALVIGISITYMLGPTPAEVKLDPTPTSISIRIDSLDDWIAKRESSFRTLKPNNEARIEWYSDSVAVTEYAVVYLHGFTASGEEGNPVHRAFAKRYGCNMYLPRLYGHGLDTTEPLIDLTPDNYLQSAKEAIAVGKQIGKKVILMCTSTGGTLGLYLAAHDPEIDAIICYSPNIDIYDQNSRFLTRPWGLQLVRLIMGSNYRQYEAPSAFNKDAEHQDNVVSVDAMRQMMPQLATPNAQKQMVEFPVGAHVLTNPLRNPDVEPVKLTSFQFAEDVIGLKPIN